MINKEMKTLTIGETIYEIVDEAARSDINMLKQGAIITDPTLTQEGKAADAKATGDAIATIQGAIVTDSTLTQEGKAADAKATGDAISAIPRVEVGNTQPTDEGVELWIDTTEGMETINIPEINDNGVSFVDTWSSNKISEMIFEMTHPIGKIIYTTRSGNPSAYLGGGTWEQIKDVFLLAAGSIYAAGNTGGEATHILTVDEMPAHSHGLGYNNYKSMTSSTSESDTSVVRPSEFTYSYTDETGTLSIGGSQPHNNMPPYKVVYVWERVA